jgi:hypothetical protein
MPLTSSARVSYTAFADRIVEITLDDYLTEKPRQNRTGFYGAKGFVR